MLTITEATLAALTRQHMFDRIRRFLGEQTSDPALLALLATPDVVHDLWLPWYDRFDGLSEHAIAVRLSYILAARARGFEPELASVAGEDADVEMKARLEALGILPFIAFDEG